MSCGSRSWQISRKLLRLVCVGSVLSLQADGRNYFFHSCSDVILPTCHEEGIRFHLQCCHFKTKLSQEFPSSLSLATF